MVVYNSFQEYENNENASTQSKVMNKKDKRKNHQGKDKPLTVSLKDFQSEGNMCVKSVCRVTVLSLCLLDL